MQIKNGKVGFSAIWDGRSDRKSGEVSFKLELSASELGATLYIASLYGHQLGVIVWLDEEKIKIPVGNSVVNYTRTKRDGSSVISLLTNLEEWRLSAQQQLSFNERLLTIIVTDLSEEAIENVNENEEQENVGI